LTLSCISGIFREMKSGIYKITNKVNGKFYIGSSYDIEERWVVHKQYLHGNYHVNPKLQHAWNKYGEDNFVFEILEEVEAKQDLLFERENYYLSTLKPYERDVGLNICPKAEGGDNITHNPNRDKFIEKMKVVNAGEGNGMFGKKHSENSILEQKEKAKGRYTLDWFIERYGQDRGNKKFADRRQMLMNRKINYITDPNASFMSFKGHKHKKNFKEKSNQSKLYFKEHWNEFVELVKSGKYSQRQLSNNLGISRQTLRQRIREIDF
jgi:group I intron endonuclease